MNIWIGRALLVLALLARPSLAAEPTTEYRCEGPFGRDASYVKLVKTFGAANVAREEIREFDAEMTILFPSDPKRRLIMSWHDQKNRRGLAAVYIRRPSTWSIAGIAIGTPLTDVERLNGKPFKLNYFEGDYGGAIISWQGGRFSTPLHNGCRVGASVTIENEAIGPMDQEVAPDRTLLSSGRGLRSAKPTVSEIVVSFPE